MYIIYVDIVLICILMALSVCACVYCAWQVRALRARGRVLPPPARVLLRYGSLQNDTARAATLRTVVAYKHPLSGEYCVRKSSARASFGLTTNPLPAPEQLSPDSGLSEHYEPLDARPFVSTKLISDGTDNEELPRHCSPEGVDRPRRWRYSEYQI